MKTQASGKSSGRIIKLANAGKTKIIAAVLLLTNIIFFSPAVFAAEPNVSVDEAAYVNLDYYGNISEINIVKGCSLNGISEFKDYGNYESVSNMSSYDQPLMEPDGVRWNLKNISNNKRFYYNCKQKNDALELPWIIDVSYKLNGVPCKAETLAGAAGVVEINVYIKPNPRANEYYKNNMMLQVATYINMEDAYSLDAPGSQMQSVGTYKAVVFAALPGEEDTFTMRIGTNSFETEGITMMMIPGTLKQLEDIKEFKEAKDTLYDSYNAIYTSMNDVLDTMENMREGLSELQKGTEGMEEARSSFSSGKDQMNAYADKALKDLSATNAQLKNIIPYFITGQNMIKDIRTDINDINKSLNDLKDPLNNSKNNINDICDELEIMDNMLGDLNDQIASALSNLGTLAKAGYATPYEATELQGWAGIARVLNNYSGAISSLLTSMRNMQNSTEKIINITDDLIDKTNKLNDTTNHYSDEMINLLGECQNLTKLLNVSIDSTITFLTYTKSLLKTTGDLLDKASETSLSGASDVLEKSIIGLGSIPTMRNANNTVKNTLDKEFDKYEDENKFLNLDAKARLTSFTSYKNPTPASIQVILRTKEIKLDKNKDISDLENKNADIGIWGRIKNLFAKILSIFHI